MDKIAFLIFLLIGFGGIEVILAQQLTSDDDQVFLDTLQAEIETDVTETKEELVREAKAVRASTEKYATAKLTHNIFKALRVLALKELDQVPLQYRMRQPRQEEAEESSGTGGSGDDEEVGESGSSSGSGASTTARTVPLIPVLAGILKSVFGGGENATTSPLNVTHAFQHLFFPLGNPFQGVSSILRPRRPTPAPATIIKYYPVPVYPTVPATVQPVTEVPTVPTTTRILRLVGRRHGRELPGAQREIEPLPPVAAQVPSQPKNTLYNPNMDSIYAPGYPAMPIRKQTPEESPPTTTSAPPLLIYAPNHLVHQGYAPSHPLQKHTGGGPSLVTQSQETTPEVVIVTTTPKPRPTYLPVFAEAIAFKTTTLKTGDGEAPTTSGIEASPETDASIEDAKTKDVSIFPTTTEAPKPGLIYVDSFARDVQNSFDGLVKNLPDILKGAKDAIGLLANLREIFAEDD